MAEHDVMSDEMADLYRSMSPAQRKCFIAVVTQEWVMSIPYFSKVIFAAVRTGPPFVYTIAIARVVRAFTYAFNNGIATTAGFPAGYTATLADTNLGKPQETISGESVEIKGIAIMPLPAWCADKDAGQNSVTDELSDMRLMSVVADACSVTLQLNAGQQDYRLGVFPMLPGAGGLEGAGYDAAGEQAIQGGRLNFGFATNGRPDAENFFAMPEGLVWLPAGNRDSQLDVSFTMLRAGIVYAGGDADNNAAFGANEAAAAGIRGYTWPTHLGFSLMTHLKGRVVSKRSMVS